LKSLGNGSVPALCEGNGEKGKLAKDKNSDKCCQSHRHH